jgi:hypothetical protein
MSALTLALILAVAWIGFVSTILLGLAVLAGWKDRDDRLERLAVEAREVAGLDELFYDVPAREPRGVR